METKKTNLPILFIFTLLYIALAEIHIYTTIFIYLKIILAGLTLCVSLYLMRTDFKRYLQYIRQNKRDLWSIPLFFLADVLITVILSAFISNQSGNQSDLDQAFQHQHGFIIVLMVLMMTIIGPFMEEIIFQYFIQGFAKRILQKTSLGQQWISILAVIIATIAFMLWHVTGFKDITDLSFLLYFDLILYAIIYELTDDNLIYPIASHVIWNIFGVLMMIFAK